MEVTWEGEGDVGRDWKLKNGDVEGYLGISL